MSRPARIVTSLPILLALAGAAAAADPAPGSRYDASNVEQIRDFISPGVEWAVKHGMPITVVESQKVEWPPEYKAATEQYSGQVKLSADGRTLENYVAGQPFPKIDANDPQAAAKVMWNFDRKWLVTDGQDLRNFDADTGVVNTGGKEMTVERHFLVDHLRRLYYVGRLFVEPKPVLEPNDDGIHYKQGLFPILEPFDLKGVGILSYRYLDPEKQDDTWLYLPSLRRVRRLSSAQRSDALFGQDTDVDSYYGYDGSPAWMDWKLLGEKTVLGVIHSKNFPVKWAEGSGNFAFDDVWEKRDVWVVEGVSRQPQYAYSKRVIYIDKEAWVVLFSDIYDRAGNLWKVWINDYSFKKQAFPGAEIEYASEMGFGPAIVMADMQLVHATRASLPSPRFPGEQGIYFNQYAAEETQPEYFTIANVISAAR